MISLTQIFRAAGWANAYQAIVFDAAGGDEAFLRAALTYVLEMPGVTEVTFIAPAREAGERLRAYWWGAQLGHGQAFRVNREWLELNKIVEFPQKKRRGYHHVHE